MYVGVQVLWFTSTFLARRPGVFAVVKTYTVYYRDGATAAQAG
jgi:hypothetical protein